jgi:nucleotide-binding universal stress UspA family protein
VRKPIVVGVDGSQVARTAIAWAADVARVRNAPLSLVHAVASGVVTGESDRWVQALAIAAEAGVEEVQVRDVPGAPVEVLLAAACDAAMLVVGSRGSGAGSGLMAGFTGLSLVRSARCPVAVIPDRGASPARSSRGPVVVGFVPEPGGRVAVELAAELAATWGVRLCVVHALPGRGQDVRGSERHVRGLLEDLVGALATRFPALPVERRVMADTPLRSLLAAADTAGAVVVGQRAHATGNGVVGSTSRSVIEFGSCPVVVAPLMTAVPEDSLRR